MEEGTEDSVHRDAWLRKMNGGRQEGMETRGVQMNE